MPSRSTAVRFAVLGASAVVISIVAHVFADPSTPPAAVADTRVPLRLSEAQATQLRDNMRNYLISTQAVVGALGRNDFAAAESAAAKLAYSSEKEKKARALAGSTTAFADGAVAFLKSADAVVSAARKKDSAATLAALETTLGTCNGCHAGFRVELAPPAK